jgi:predicted esterase YcpF (UPF0227 family)
MPLPPTHLLYLHGFRSSPQSFKAQRMARAVAALPQAPQWWCPQLPASPQQAMDLLAQGIAEWPSQRMAIVGSSLGGFYAHVLARQIACPVVLLNPAVHPARDLQAYIGEHPAWHDPSQRIHFDARFVDELRTLQARPCPTPPPTLAVIAKGDEVLDWREMLSAYGHDQVRLIEGSDHALSDFESHLPQVLRFLGYLS